MVIKITLSILFVSICFQVYFWFQGHPMRTKVFRSRPTEPESKAIQIVFEQEELPGVDLDNKPFITHLVEIDTELEFTEWTVEMNQ